MTHAIDPAVVERAAESAYAVFRTAMGVSVPKRSAVPTETKKIWQAIARAVLASAIREAVEQERELIKRAYLGVSVLRTMLQKEGMRLGVQAADDLMADMASLMPELPGTLALRSRTKDNANV
jgi:hypothetical protein